MPNLNITPEWISEKAALEGDGEIGAGVPAYIPPFIPSAADRYYSAIIEQYRARVLELENVNARLNALCVQADAQLAESSDLLDAAQDALDAAKMMMGDYQTSEAHHPNHVLVPLAAFEALRAALGRGGEANG